LFRAYDRLIAHLNDRTPRPVLLYIGDGPQMAELRALRDRLSAGPDITLAGYRPDAADILGEADICVIPSVWQDAFSLAVLEAMARGRAVIATQVGGIPELVEHEVTGLLVPSADEHALAEALARLLRDPAEIARLGEAARRRAHERFSLETQVLRLAALVEEGFGSPCEPTRLGTEVTPQG
jgi:glycosyltransferase involved in cell wall biosynthesis